jgi:hypothetical protein
MAAEQAFQKGLALLRAKEAASAAIELRRAASLQPESLEYVLNATWAEATLQNEIPSEPSQRALREIAEKAKRRDPLFAFASYVLGKLAMWAGDDELAKKHFYEALRLDPTSEAGQQVRVLARRGTRAPAPPSPAATEEPSHHEATTEAAPAPPSAPVQPAKALPPPPPSSGRWTMRLVLAAALLGAAAYVIFAGARSAMPGAPREPVSSLEPAVSADAATAVDAEPGDRPPATDGREGGKWGEVRLPPRASGHRIFVDGRRFKTEEAGPLRLPCGPHVIQIGSSGAQESIDLPCGGQVQLQ